MYYSGKKKGHTLKAELVVDQASGQILCTAFSKGRCHDFRLFKQQPVVLLSEELCLADKGYQLISLLRLSISS